MTNTALKAATREKIAKQLISVRAEGYLPAVLYGHSLTNQNLTVKFIDLLRVYEQAGESTLVDLQIGEGAPVKVLIQEIQRDPVSHQIIHVDFYQVKMDEKITARIPVVLVGESPAVKEQGGILVASLSEVEVKCLPADLIKEIQVDLASLKNFGDKILVKDLSFGDKIEILVSPEVSVVTVGAPREEEVVTPAAEATPAAGAEVPGSEAPAAGTKTEQDKNDKK